MKGNHLKRLRENAGFTVQEACEQLGIGRSTLYHLEAGTRRPGPRIASRMVRVYGCTYDDLFLPYEAAKRRRSA